MLASDWPSFRFRLACIASGVLAAALAVVAAPPALAQEDRIRPVTDAELENPSPDDWLMWRRTLDGWGYSPLDQINRENVGDLRMVWSRGLRPGRQQGTPLVRDGVMFMPNPRDIIQAIDAETGDLRGSTGSTPGGYWNRSATSRRRSMKSVTMSTLRWPNSRHSLSDVPGTVQWAESDAVEEIKLWIEGNGFPSSFRRSELMGAATPTLAEFKEFRHVAAKRVPDPETVKETEASNDELERFSQLLSTLTPSRVRFLYRQRWDVLRLDPGGIPHLADAQFLERTLRVLDTWNRQDVDVD